MCLLSGSRVNSCNSIKQTSKAAVGRVQFQSAVEQRKTLGAEASHSRSTSFGTVASKSRGPCALLLTFVQIFQRVLVRWQRSGETSNKGRQLSEFYRSQTSKRDILWFTQLPNDGAPNAFGALIDLLPCVRGGMKPHSKTSIHG